MEERGSREEGKGGEGDAVVGKDGDDLNWIQTAVLLGSVAHCCSTTQAYAFILWCVFTDWLTD